MAPNSVKDAAAKGDRIAKLLARAGIASRREVERMIAEGRVALDGAVVDTPATILSSLRGVTVDGNPVAAPEPTRLFLFHKPTGLLVTERDPKGRATIYDRLPRDLPRLVPVGRLDLNTEGLLLLTTDGGFKRQLELPSTGVERTYRVRAYGNVTQAQLEDLADGIEIEGIRYGSIDANIERRTGANVWIEMTLTEGKNREVRRVLEHLGLQVGRLIRTRYGPFLLGDLPTGEIGEVKQHELVAFRRTLKGGAPEEIATDAPRPGFRTAPTVDRTARARSRTGSAEPQRPARAARVERTGGDHPRVVRPLRPGDSPDRTPRGLRAGEAPRPARTPRTDRADGDRSRAVRPQRANGAGERTQRNTDAPRGDRAERTSADSGRTAPRGQRRDGDAARPPRNAHPSDAARPERSPRPASDSSRSPRSGGGARAPRPGSGGGSGPGRPGRGGGRPPRGGRA
ncbi:MULTISPECIES: pseudouridine synthase [unclassified Sphingomonas]|uniref:pseudouridine synthase n=1 Tax=unclassified Sphingomonas TaxID=196159 RepID=UPI000E103FFE|nr:MULTISPECIES: pseudouridine synthase [unclassified Sphingomonas]AXJ96658.1 pseudouridine synthase [Sphingomonas sp. FARSPH]